MPISKNEGTAKGVSLFYMLKSKLPQPMTEKETNEEFKGSSGWWWNFSNRMNLKSETLQEKQPQLTINSEIRLNSAETQAKFMP